MTFVIPSSRLPATEAVRIYAVGFWLLFYSLLFSFLEPRFSGQHMFDQRGPAPLMNNSVLPISGQGPPSFPPQGGLGSPGFASLGLRQNQGPQGGGIFQREPPRPGLPPQHGGPPGPRGFVGHRQPFSPQQQGPPFSPQHMPFGMQVRQRVSQFTRICMALLAC